MTRSTSQRQIFAISAAAASAPAVAAAAALPWPWVLVTALLTAAVAVGLSVLLRAAGGNLAEVTVEAFGRRTGAVLLVLQIAMAAVLTGQLALGTSAAFPEDRAVPFVPLTLLAVCLWACCHGEAAVVRGAGVLFLPMAALYLTIFFFAVPDADFSRVTQVSEAADLLPLAVTGLLPLYGLYLTREAEPQRNFPVGILALGVLLPPAASLLTAAVPGAHGSFYTMAKSVEVLSVAQRIEPLVSVAQTLGWFAALSLPALAAGNMAVALKLPPVWITGAVLVPAAAGAVWGKVISAGWLLGFGAVFCVIFPLLALVIVGRKKLSKK